jgi:hypothetical protein
MSYIGSIEQLGMKNDNFREVVFTGTKSQLVVMSIPVNTDVGEETHESQSRQTKNLQKRITYDRWRET